MLLLRKSRKRLYYLPGMLSLVLLPLVCLQTLDEHQAFRKQYITPVAWRPKPTKEHQQFWLERKYMDIRLTEDEDSNRRKLRQARLAIRQMVRTSDTVHGVHFILEEKALFGSFMQAIDICKQENQEVFVPDNHDIRAFCPAPRRVDGSGMELPVLMCGYRPVIDEAWVQKRKRDAMLRHALITLRHYAIPFVLFLLLVLPAALRHRRRSRTFYDL